MFPGLAPHTPKPYPESGKSIQLQTPLHPHNTSRRPARPGQDDDDEVGFCDRFLRYTPPPKLHTTAQNRTRAVLGEMQKSQRQGFPESGEYFGGWWMLLLLAVPSVAAQGS